MGITCNLAMSAGEFFRQDALAQAVGWMACHFSSYGSGLSNLPTSLPEGALLILDDSTPIDAHDPDRICRQLLQTVQSQKCSAVLLDFERAPTPRAEAVVHEILRTLPCPVGVSSAYAALRECAVFVPPVPPDVAIDEHLAPWRGRDIWMEIGANALMLTVTRNGCLREAGTPPLCGEMLFDERLCCHYTIRTNHDSLRFFLTRTASDLAKLLARSEVLGVTRAVGLYQEFSEMV